MSGQGKQELKTDVSGTVIHGGFSMKSMAYKPEHVVERVATVFLRLLVLVAFLVVAASLTSGCMKGSQKPPAPVDSDSGSGSKQATPDKPPLESKETRIKPRLVNSYEVQGQLWSVNPDLAISPDGKYLLTIRNDNAGIKVVVLPISDSESVDADGVTLHSVDKDWVEEHMFGYYPLGWINDTRCIFVVQGWQNKDHHMGKYGTAFFEGDVKKASSEETAFIDLPEEAYLNFSTFIPATGKAYIDVGGEIWAYDVRDRSLQLVKKSLPTYDGLFNPKISPDGRYFVYEMYEEDKRGIFLLDAATGSERPLLLSDETMSFYPSWSPDGQYIAAYTASRKAAGQDGEAPGNDWDDYEVLPAEDGLMPVAEAISIVNLNGDIVNTIRIDGKTISDFMWSPTGNAIAFLCGTVRKSDTDFAGFDEFLAESVYLAEPTGGDDPPLKLADIHRSPPEGDSEELTGFVILAGVDPDGRGVLYNDYRGETVSVSHVRVGATGDPVKIEGGVSYYGVIPVYGDSLLSIVEGSGKSGVWFLTPDGAEEIVSFEKGRTTSLLGFNKDTVVIGNEPVQFALPVSENTTCTVMVFKVDLK